jgi:4-amino-4-deoxy-L-arabinose transferase-like glycosyltransferase
MAETGDIVTPRLNSRTLLQPQRQTVPFYEKPIAVYWLCASSMALLGKSEWAARLPVALLSLAVTLMVYALGRRRYGERAGLLAGIVYATAPMTLIDARQMTTDALLVTWFTLAMIGFWITISHASDAGSESEEYRSSGKTATFTGPALFWLGCGLSVLTKGAVGLLLPMLVVGIFAAVEHGRISGSGHAVLRTFLQLKPAPGLLLFLAIAVPWHAAILRVAETDANGRTWFQEYILRQHIGRFRGLDKVHNAPPPTYLLYFLVGFFPWSCLAPAAFLFRRPAEETNSQPSRDRFRTLLLVWFWTIFLFFSASSAKLPTYIVPAYPAAALLMGGWLDALLAGRLPQKRYRAGFAAAAVVASMLLIGAIVGPRFSRYPLPADIVTLAHSLGIGLTVCMVVAWILTRFDSERARTGAVAALASGSLVLIGLGCSYGYDIARRTVQDPYQSLAKAANGDANRGMPVLYFNIVPIRPSMFFYARYSPIEARGKELTPILDRILSPAVPQMDLIATRNVVSEVVQPDVQESGRYTAQLLKQTGDSHGGWALVRIQGASMHSKP